MKKLLALALSLGMALSLSSCGGKPVTLETQTINGITVDIPSDIGAFTEQNGGQMATNEEKTAVITIDIPRDADGIVPADLDQEAFQAQMYADREDVEFISYDNASEVDGIPAIISNCKMKNTSGVSVAAYTIIFFPEDGTIQQVMFSYTNDKGSSVEKNIDAIAGSVKKG